MPTSVRSALGQSVPIGTLYDATTDNFIPSTIIPQEALPGLLRTRPTLDASESCVYLAPDGTYPERLAALSISEDLAASIIAKLCVPRGAGVYLRERDEWTLSAAVHHQVSTLRQRLDLGDPNLRASIDLKPLQSAGATHVVVGIHWGLHSIIEITHHLPGGELFSGKFDGQFKADAESLRAAVQSADSSSQDGHHLGPSNLQLECMLYSEAFGDEGLMLESREEAMQFIRLVPDQISQQNGGLGWPIFYNLLPLSILNDVVPLAGQFRVSYSPGSQQEVARIPRLVDSNSFYTKRLRSVHSYLLSRRAFVTSEQLMEVERALDQLQKSRKNMLEKLRALLVEIRDGQQHPDKLEELLDWVDGDTSPYTMPTSIVFEDDRLDFICASVERGAIYVGHNSPPLQDILRAQKHRSISVFFCEAATNESNTWEDHCKLVTELLDEQTSLVLIAGCDLDQGGLKPSAIRISQFEQGEEVISDLLEHRRYTSATCFAHYQEDQLEASVKDKPVSRCFVKIPCPCFGCDSVRICEWTCSRCHVTIEYGFKDDYFYCDCGRAPFNAYEFKCNGEKHGSDYAACHSEPLKDRLLKLDQSDYLNILILGETGVGKSTFINAFINYLSHSSLDEAKAADELASVIPLSFSVQDMNRDDPTQGIVERNIKVGSRDDEADGAKGASATQKTNVYSVNIGATTYRLIDTPGIGDTKGYSYDKQNMADILQTLSSYETIHGILILLKSNNARLTITFRFCVNELLTHLHRSAVENMAFGFTNTRISNYAPGDTFRPLKELLHQHSDIGLDLSTANTYCFDSECFRYLAAYKNGYQMPNEDDFRRSWEQSRGEARRLVDHFKSRKPHDVQSTLSLNGARQLISELTKPMAEISKLIRDNISRLEDRKQQLDNARLTAGALRSKLMLDKIQFSAERLERPRTVCKNTTCCDFKDSGKGDGETVTIYKTHCHKVCSLQGVRQDTVGAPGLINCAAFRGANMCGGCGHHWQEHLHVLYELKEVVVRVTDTEIERQLRLNASDVSLRKTGINEINRLVAEYKKEHEEIKSAAARFGVFLKKHAITPVNDATLEYLDMLIQDEDMKIQGGRQHDYNVDVNVRRLKALKEDRAAHVELVDTLQRAMNTSQCPRDVILSEKGVDVLASKLFRLKHFGENLKSVKNTITLSHQATYRERPYRVFQRVARPTEHRGVRGSDFSKGKVAGEEVGNEAQRATSGKATAKAQRNRLTGWIPFLKSGS